MTPRRKEPRSFLLIASTCALGMAAILTLGACGLETIVAPEEAMEAPQLAVDINETTESPQGTAEPGRETAEVATAAADGGPEGSSGTFAFVCPRRSPLLPADMPLIILDGEVCVSSFDEIAALDIESFEIVKRSDAVEVYGEDGRNGAVLIFTKQSGGDGKGDGSPGEPSN